ncbi:MAG: FRG domain-containing protein [Clostridiales bacterium]|nr:FRG domain-containing protein [Clostridiales bacterium]
MNIDAEYRKAATESSLVRTIGRAGSVQQYLRIIDMAFKDICPPNNKKCELWYRGQPDAKFDLIPKIGRKPLNPELEIVYLSKFKSLAIPDVQCVPPYPIADNSAAYWHWLFLMQHYGVPTRLMDWSRDAFVALFFSIDQLPSSVGNDAAVWVLSPVKLNEAFSFYSFVKPGYIPNIDEKPVNTLFGPNANILKTKKPAAIVGPINNPRILAQRGVFTVFPHTKKIVPLNMFNDASDYLFKISIASESINFIKEQLTRYGITRFSLFPDLCNITEEIDLQVKREGQLP